MPPLLEGEGWGEGNNKVSIRFTYPHPNLLPKGEGTVLTFTTPSFGRGRGEGYKKTEI